MRSISSSTMVWGCIVAFIACVLYDSGTLAQANHLKGASSETLERMLKQRLRPSLVGNGKPYGGTLLPIRPAGKPRKLGDGRTALPWQMSGAIAGSSIINVLYYDGERIRYDWRRDDIPEDVQIWGFSMTKSIASWLVGKALCGGRIESLDDRIKKYVPQLDNSFYGATSIKDALDMSSGDKVLYSPSDANRINNTFRALGRRVNRGMPIIDTLLRLGNTRPGRKEFHYNAANPYAVGAVLFSVMPEGFGEFAGKAMADDAGLRHPSTFRADRNGIPLSSSGFYATRMDWLRLGVRIAEQFKAEGCIGDYLRSAVVESVPTGRPQSRKYGKFFWFDNRNVWFKNDAMMKGHGGQRVVMDLDQGRVLIIHAIRKDYKSSEIISAAFGR